MNDSVFWSIPEEFVTSSRGQCDKCQNVTMLFLSKTKENKEWVAWSYIETHVFVKTVCVNCIQKHGGQLIHQISEKLQFSGGTFKCPARVCKGILNFEMFMNRECCPAAQSEGIKELFSDFDKRFTTQKPYFSVSDIAAIKGKINTFNEKYIHYFSKDDPARYNLAKNQFKQLGDTLKIAKRDCKAGTVDNIKNELDSFIEEFANFFPKNDRNSCAICMEKYDEKNRVESTLLCGHRACFECLNKLPNKNCPTCRKAFTNEQIIKLF